MNRYPEILEAITDISKDKTITVVGIDGLGGAGKSTVSEKICQKLKETGIHTVLLHIDDLIHPRSVRYNSEFPEWQCYYDLQWRYDYLREIINAAKKSPDSALDIELYDKDNDSYFREKYNFEAGSIIIVEGIFLQRKEIRDLFDCMIYIDIPEAVRLERVLKRDTYIGSEESITEKYENRYFPAEHRYVSEYSPESSADLVFADTDLSE